MKVFYTAFICSQFGFVIFWWNNICKKAARKMLVKLTTGVNFSNILCATFVHTDHKSKKTNSLTVLFAPLGSVGVKASGKMLVKLTIDYVRKVTKCFAWTHLQLWSRSFLKLSHYWNPYFLKTSVKNNFNYIIALFFAYMKKSEPNLYLKSKNRFLFSI